MHLDCTKHFHNCILYCKHTTGLSTHKNWRKCSLNQSNPSKRSRIWVRGKEIAYHSLLLILVMNWIIFSPLCVMCLHRVYVCVNVYKKVCCVDLKNNVWCFLEECFVVVKWKLKLTARSSLLLLNTAINLANKFCRVSVLIESKRVIKPDSIK